MYPTGSTFDSVTSAIIKDLKVPLYNVILTSKISSLLSSIDKLIEMHKKLTVELEEELKFIIKKIFKNYNIHKIKLIKNAQIYQQTTISQNKFVDYGKYKVFGANGYIGKYDKYNHKTEQVTISYRGKNCGTVEVDTTNNWK